MRYDDHLYHTERAEHCRTMARLADDPDVRRRHEELASLHAGRAALYNTGISANATAAL